VPLQSSSPVCYSSAPRCDAAQQEEAAGHTEQNEVDDERKTLHNLTSLLLTNTTICRQAASKQYRKFFKN
jgi:hypothetical protein